MDTLPPSGTVTLLFSDIEGSTMLLSRLGPAYAEALDGQRRVLRAAWSAHGGAEMGTEGDSFFVAFATAPAAVSAAAQAQRELAAFEWPAGEQVRVRMGIHTGCPTVHDGGYVGMDVHRAARISGAAHGGQVVVSQATAHLVDGYLPDGVLLQDLGSHHLKDIPQPERLFQLRMEGLPADFAALKTLGAASSLPVPATPLVGRDGELAELAAVLESPGVRLVTLTGPGGTGKTRLAIGLAQRVTEWFPDGVYFVPLAAITTADVMWTSIAEVLDVPAEGRIPPGFFAHVAHRSALFVLDNLEQVAGADTVVSELLNAAPQVMVVSTSRRPLHVAAEHEHAVPPLELPDDSSLSKVEKSGAVQMFVHHARRVKASFALNASNAAAIALVCRRLDGLPLAIELAAARSKLLSPVALLSRLDTALDLKDTGVDRPTRQQTLRETIAWSYVLLTAELQAFFRQLGVFAGGADLDAISAIAADAAETHEPLDLVAELVDASMLTVEEAPDGEPRFILLETVRAYAVDQLTAHDELDTAQERHAHHFLSLAEALRSRLDSESRRDSRMRFEADRDNFRAALGWALPSKPETTDPVPRTQLGMRLCLALEDFWASGGYFTEALRWLQRVTENAGGSDSPELARFLSLLADSLRRTGEIDRAAGYAMASVNMWRRLDDASGLASAVRKSAAIEADSGRFASARALYEEAIAIARESNDRRQLYPSLTDLALLEASEQNFQPALDLHTEAIDTARELGSPYAALICQHNLACALRQMGRFAEAEEQMRTLIPLILDFSEPELLMFVAEDYAAVLSKLGDHERAVRLLGAADAMRERIRTPRAAVQQAEIDEPMNDTRAALSAREWDDAYQQGRTTTVEDSLTRVHAEGSGEDRRE